MVIAVNKSIGYWGQSPFLISLSPSHKWDGNEFNRSKYYPFLIHCRSALANGKIKAEQLALA